MFRRHLEPHLASAARQMPAVTVLGPRQSGKTTLVRHGFPDHEYVSLERLDVRDRALDDPVGFLAGLSPTGVILDEVQRAPDLLSYLQVQLDEDPTPGRVILTGSQNLLLMEQIAQTLAGRTAVLTLLPLSLSELRVGKPLDPPNLAESVPGAAPSGRSIWETVWTGFYPRIHDRGLPPQDWLADYQRTYVERDLRDLLRILDLDSFERFVRLCAARTGQLLNLSDLASDAGVSQPTARKWLTALRIGFLAVTLSVHSENFSKRLRKQPKLHFFDTGLVCYLLGIPNPTALERHPLRGAIFESYVFAELYKAFVHRRQEPPLYHWRDARQHELDLLIDCGDHLLPLECKSGMTVPSDATAGLRRWLDLPGNPNQAGVLVHGGSDSFTLHGIRVLPWYLG